MSPRLLEKDEEASAESMFSHAAESEMGGDHDKRMVFAESDSDSSEED